MKLLLIGHVCVDKNVVRGQTETLYGGGVIHGAMTAQRLGLEAAVITKCSDADKPHFRHLAEAGVQTHFLPSPASTSIRNVYPSENPDERQSFLISKAASFTEKDLHTALEFKPDWVHVNPLWFGEFPSELLRVIRDFSPRLGADAQGFLRVAESDGTMRYRDFPEKIKVFSGLDLFKVDSKEALLLTGETEPTRAVQAVQALGPACVLLTHQGGVCVFDGRRLCQGAFTSFTLEGRTGRGDTCTASFLVGLSRGMDLENATHFAAEITSRKMQYRGPYRS